jgi:hypothetical protein
LTGWYNGDFNYDGVINGDDYTLIENAFSTQGSTTFAGVSAGPAEIIAADTSQVASMSSSAVPEPGSLMLVAVLFAERLLMRRRNPPAWGAGTRQAAMQKLQQTLPRGYEKMYVRRKENSCAEAVRFSVARYFRLQLPG